MLLAASSMGRAASKPPPPPPPPAQVSYQRPNQRDSNQINLVKLFGSELAAGRRRRVLKQRSLASSSRPETTRIPARGRAASKKAKSSNNSDDEVCESRKPKGGLASRGKSSFLSEDELAPAKVGPVSLSRPTTRAPSALYPFDNGYTLAEAR
jgi:hypothetical protein